ncbi:MAG: WGR domain-containing protein [Magnetococcus sp. DMHC-6]
MKAYLQRLNPANGLICYYSLQIQRDLLGRWQVIREWGKSGSPGTLRRSPYDTHAQAVDALRSLRDQLTQKGYLVVMQEGLSRGMAAYIEEGDSSDVVYP